MKEEQRAKEEAEQKAKEKAEWEKQEKQCKDNIRSDYRNTADVDYPNILGSKSFTPDKDPILSDKCLERPTSI